MNKKYIIYFSFFCIFNLTKIESRVLFNPSINNCLWYFNTIEYPLDFYFNNKRLDFVLDLGLSYLSRYANKAIVDNSIELGNNFSVLFHGADNFILNDFQPISNNIADDSNSVYEFLPDYVFNESSCQINLQVSKDFQYSDDRYVHSTVRCVIPFSSQSVVNIASGNMYYNTAADNVRKKSYRANYDNDCNRKNKLVKNKNNLNNNKKIKNSCKSVSPYIKLKQIDGNDLFAIQGSYFAQGEQSLFSYYKNNNLSDYVVFNKNFAGGNLLDENYNFLSLSDVAHSYGLLSGGDGKIFYAQLVFSNGEYVLDEFQREYQVQNVPYAQNDMKPNYALVPLYTYGNSDVIVDGAFYVNDDFGFSYSLNTDPKYISDVSIGDLVSSSNIVYGNGLTGKINTDNMLKNKSLKVVATGNYGKENIFLGDLWDRQEVEFVVPPVVVQFNENEFPEDFGVKIDLKNIAQPYKNSLDGEQFDFYGDFLKNNELNKLPKVTILNSDGTFYDKSADCALLWYQNDYTKLLNNPTDSVIKNNLKNIYFTSSINSELGVPTKESKIIYKKINENPSPDVDCCQKVVNWVVSCVYNPIVTNLNENFPLLQSQIWSLVNVGNNVVGNQSPIFQKVSNDIPNKPECENWQNYSIEGNNRSIDDNFKFGSLSKIFDNSGLFENGEYGTMQYNGFNQSGMGDILLEFLIGSYFLQNTLLFDLYLALECPTAEKINENKSYLSVGIGNNGHYVGRLGIQGSFDIETIFRFRFSGKAYFEHGFNSLEKLVPQLNGYPIFGMIPVKMDSNVSWNGCLMYIDGSFYANDFSGFTLSYQYWKKDRDELFMISPKKLVIPNSDDILGVNFDGSRFMSLRDSHTFGMSLFSRIMNEFFINCGLSRVIAGKNIPQVTDFYFSVGVNY